MTASVPSVGSFYWPALQALRTFDGPVDRARAIGAVVDAMGLSEEQRAVHGPKDFDKESLAEYRAAWALSHLKIMGLADNPQRGQWVLLPEAATVDEPTVLARWRETSKRYREPASGSGSATPSQTWLVGAMIGRQDQTSRFVQEGIWEVDNPSVADLNHVRAMAPGDRIAIKAAFTQKHGLPFDNGGATVSVMRIKARGEITRVSDDRVFVEWQPIDPARDWYFYTGRSTIWRLPQNEMAAALEAFVFEDAPQDIETFLAEPYWASLYGTPTSPSVAPQVASAELDWIPFYEAIADEVLKFRDQRPWLAEAVASIRANNGLGVWNDKFDDGTMGPLADIDPGTAMAIFNLGPTPFPKRQRIAQDLAEALGLDLPAPESFNGVPISHPQSTWLFGWQKDRGDAVDLLWTAFADGVRWADDPENDDARSAFAASLGPALDKSNWQLATALYRCRPMFFCPLDSLTRGQLAEAVGVRAPTNQHAADAALRYVGVLDDLRAYLNKPDSPVHTIPDFSLRAWNAHVGGETGPVDTESTGGGDSLDAEEAPDAGATYTLDDLVAEGCFVPRAELERILATLGRTKNLILQGAPGTGKTWLAKRLGWVLAGRRSASDVRVVQFHPNTSYEDFVRGYRPTARGDGEASLKLVDGPFLQLADDAHGAPDRKFTMVVEEINRGNPARALGELLTLIEASKRTAEDAIRLTYPRLSEVDGVWLPPNLHVIGTMNVADRSLALVDLALRRRFAFVTLAPQFGVQWRAWLLDRIPAEGADAFVDAVARGVTDLNDAISQDPTLGSNFVVGHSFFTPDQPVSSPREWFVEQVESSVRPLLHEYWFDNGPRADDLADRLLGHAT